MKKARFHCDRCNLDFEVDIFEPGEAQEKGQSAGPVCCPKCGGAVRRK